MSKLLSGLLRDDDHFMTVVYLIGLVMDVAYLYVVWFSPYSLQSQLFGLIYSFLDGVMAVQFLLLLGSLYIKKTILLRRNLLLLLAVTESVSVLIDVVYACLFGDFWLDGYVFLAFQAVMISIYLRRYFALRRLQIFLSEGDDAP